MKPVALYNAPDGTLQYHAGFTVSLPFPSSCLQGFSYTLTPYSSRKKLPAMYRTQADSGTASSPSREVIQ